MGKISDIWVRLGLKKDGFDKGMDDAGKKAEGFGGRLEKIKAGAVAVWAAIGASVLAFGKKMTETTNAVGDAWNRFTAQAKAGWDTFVQSLSAMNWTDFIGRFREATQAAKELQNALDAEFEISNSIKLQKAAMEEELNALEILARNSSKPYEVRAKAAQDYLDKVRPLYQQEIDLANKLLDARQGKWLAGTGLTDNAQTRDDLTKFLIDYGKTNNGLADSLSQLFALQAQRDVTAKTMMKSGNFKALQSTLERQDAEIASLMEYINAFASQNGYQTDITKLARVYETLRGDADTQPLVDALIRAGQAAGAFDRETKRMQMALNTATAALENASESMAQTVERQDLSLPEVAGLQGFAEVQMPDLITHEWLERQKQMGLEAVDWQARMLQTMSNATQMFEDALVSSMMNGLQALADLMMGVEGADMKNVLAAFIAPFGDTMKQMGAMIMAEGIAMEAFKESFKNPWAAIAAGAALMALGSVVSAGLQRLTANPVGGGSSSYSGGGSYGSSELMNYENTLTVYVEGRISGSDIIIAGQNQQNKWNR